MKEKEKEKLNRLKFKHRNSSRLFIIYMQIERIFFPN